MSRPIIRPYRSGDEEAILALHNQAFGNHWTPEHWRWRYQENPLRCTHVLTAFDEDSGACIASFSGVGVEFQLHGAETQAINQSDIAVHPTLRSGLGGSRLLVDMIRQYFEYCSSTASLIWGYPEPALRRIATKYAGVGILCDVLFLARRVELPCTFPSDIEIREVARFTDEVDRLWQVCSSKWGASIKRDSRYLNWRFADHPRVSYRLLEARDKNGGALRGIATIREGGWHAAILSLCEWLVPEDDRDAEAALIAHAIQTAKDCDKSHLICWFPSPQIQFHRFQIDHGFFVQTTPYQEGYKSWSVKLPRNWLFEAWYQTMGDMDFF